MKTKNLIITGIITVFFSLFSQQTSAQFGKGNWLAEGSIGNISITNTKSETSQQGLTSNSETKGFGFAIFPKAGYFITDDLVLGASLSFGVSSSKSEGYNSNGIRTSESKSSTSYVGLSPFLRYYFKGTDKLRFYGQLQAGYDMDLSDKYDTKSYNGTTGVLQNTATQDYKDNYAAPNVSGAIGLNYFLTDNVALNSSIGYYYSKATYSYSYSVTNVQTGVTSTQPDVDYSSTRNNIIWNVGFTMIVCRGKSASTDK